MWQNIFNTLVRKKSRIISFFNLFWISILVLFVIAASAIIDPVNPRKVFWYSAAVFCGKLALIVFTITLSPGIFKRFGIRNRLLGLIMIFRRQFGITMFLLAAFHGTIVSIIPKLIQGPPIQLLLFEIFGSLSLFLLFFLFLTSNDLSQLKMGIWWYRLHRLVYIIMWLILFHVGLQRISIWSLLAAILVLSEMTGIIYTNLKRNNPDLSL